MAKRPRAYMSFSSRKWQPPYLGLTIPLRGPPPPEVATDHKQATLLHVATRFQTSSVRRWSTAGGREEVWAGDTTLSILFEGRIRGF